MKMRTMVVAVLVLAAGCAPMEDRVMEDRPVEDGIERWKCGDSCYGSSGNCPVRLTANFRDGTGEVNFDGVVERTNFQIQGLERRWDWCLANDGAFDCAFVISVDGRGSYYNFRAGEYGLDGKRRAKPADLFTCEKS